MSVRFVLTVVSVDEYLRAGTNARAMLPDCPALYFWNADLRKVERSRVGSTLEMAAQLHRLIQAGSREFHGRVNPFYAVSVADKPRELGPQKLGKLFQLVEKGAAGWALLCGTVLQRPLYVGRTSNLEARARDHLTPGSAFRQYLEELGVDFLDCCLAYVLCDELMPRSAPEEDSDEYDLPLLEVAEAIVTRTARPVLNRRLE